jgi:hypothetical protein
MIDDMVAKYIELRDRKAALKAQFTADTEAIDAMLDRCERHFLTVMNEQGLESLPTAAGVPYKQHRTSATVADWDQTLNWIKTEGAWHMLDRRVNKTAVEAYREANNDLPPGVNWRDEIVVNVRRKQ